MQFVRHTFSLSVLALTLAQSAHAAQFSNVFAFGDSLSDAGQYGAHFTTNPGFTAIEDVGSYFGSTLKPSTQGGTDYAYGGARISTQETYSPQATPVAGQVTSLLSKGPLDANALYSVWGGANDIIYHVGLAGAGAESAAQVQAAVTRAATDELAQIARLHNGGARYIVVFNMPDIGRTPAGTATPAAPFSDLSSLYNLTLSVGLDSLGFDVIPVNAFALLNEVIANPATYGFSNATIPACTVASSLTCTPSTLREPNAGTTYVFADALHPTTAAHALLAQYVESIIEAPEKVALLAEVPLQLAGSQRRAIESRYISSPGPRAKGKIDVYAAYDYNPSTLDRTAVSPGNDNTGHTLTVGGDTRISDALSAGLAFGYSWNKSDLDNNAGGFDLDAAMLTAYAAYSVSSAYIAGLATVGDLDYKDVRRNINLGPAVRTESGNAKGSLQSYTLTGGYLFNTGSLRHGPVATVTYQKVLVNDFAESGTNSTAMRFGDQERESLVSSLGWQLTGVMPAGGIALLPFARVAYEHDSKDEERTVRAGLVSMGGSFAMPVFQPGNNWTRVDLGLSSPLSPSVTGFVGYSGVFGQDNAKSNALTLGVKLAL